MKSEKKSNKKKDPKQKQPTNDNVISGNTLSMGELDLIFEINFTDQDLENPNPPSEEKRYYKLENLHTIKDLSFMSSLSSEFISKIKLKPNNHLIRQLLLGNKISKKKNIIEFICYNRPLFEEDNDKYFQKIFDQVCMNYKLNINKKPLYYDGRYSLILQLKHKDEYKEIILGKTPKSFRENKFKEDKEKRDLEEVAENDKEEIERKEREEKKKEKMENYREERERKKNEKKGNSNNNKNRNQSPNKSGSPRPNKSGSPNKSPNKKAKKKKKEEQKEDSSCDEDDDYPKEDEDYDMNDAMKEKRIPKFRRQNTVLCNLSPMYTKYDLVYFNFEIIKNIPGDFNMKDFIELLIFFKKKKILVFINFFKEDPEEDELEEEKRIQETLYLREEKKKEKEQKLLEKKQKKEEEIAKLQMKIIALKEKKQNIKENKKEEIKNMTEKKKAEELKNIQSELDTLELELIEKQDDYRADQEIDIEFKKREELNKKSKEKALKKQEQKQIKLLNDIYYLTDIYFFDSKQACDAFTKHYLNYTKDTDKTKKINRQKLYDYFITVITRGQRPVVEGKKVGLFMDDFNKYCIIYTSKKAANKQDLNPQPFPKVNPHNIDLVNRYKEILSKFKNDYYDIFICLSGHEISASHGIISPEIIYPTFLAGLDIVKRLIELEKNGIESYDEDSMFKVKISEKALKLELEKLSIDGREGNFVLDCTNKNKSAIKDYVSLYDYNLKDFFSSDIIRKNLQDKGFINSEGYIMYDPLYRNIMGSKFKNSIKYKGEELKAKIVSNIKSIDVPARLKDKEYDPKKAVEKQINPINRKIPFVKTKKKKKRAGCRTNSERDGCSSESDRTNSNNSSNINESDK